MLTECRKALKIETDQFDDDLCLLMDAGARDLRIAGVELPGTVSFTKVSETTGSGADAVTTEYMEDGSTLNDPIVMRAIFTYVRMHFFMNAPNWDRVKESYEIQKGQLMHADDYTDYTGGDGE